jgi:hypothetical protein
VTETFAALRSFAITQTPSGAANHHFIPDRSLVRNHTFRRQRTLDICFRWV